MAKPYWSAHSPTNQPCVGSWTSSGISISPSSPSKGLKMKTNTLLFLVCLLVSGCIQINSQPTEVVIPETPTIQPTMSTLPNPASAYCEQQGYTSEIRTATDGSQSGVCIFPDGSECDEWAYYRKECAPASEGGSLPNPASVFCEQQGYKLEIR